MQKNIAKTVIACVAFMAVVLGLTTHRILSPAVMTRDQLNEAGLFVYDIPRRLNDFTLHDQHGEAFTRDNFKGHWNIVFFGYTFCPDICPLTMAAINRFEAQLNEADSEAAATLQVVMVSVDPERDTPEKLADYVSFFGADYVGATGAFIDIFNLARQVNVAFGYTPQDDGDYLVSHSGEIILINPEGDFHGFFKVEHDPAQMVRTFLSVYNGWQH